ncbi:MAG TPA: amidase [Thermoanaerobaculia bacterium]|nr:amidase [Thermoanaerobaculia bacterium]
MSPARIPEENQPIPGAEDERKQTEVSRRTFLQWGALAGASAPVAGILGTPSPAAAAPTTPTVEPAVELVEATIAELQEAMTRGGLTSLNLVNMYLDRIRELDQSGPEVFAVLEVNPDARRIARRLDRERKNGHVRGPLHGIPILLKDNIDTGDRMETTAGSLALAGNPAPQDATVTARLRAAGAVILGKANLSEFANFRGFNSSSGWSGKGGQTKNPYVLDRNPCGSSSGSGAAVSANFVTAALATETDGSIVCPAHINGIVGIKPTVGLTSRAGVVPISHTQDTVGPHARTVADAAAVLGALVGVDPRDPATAASAGHFHTDYTQFLDPDGLRGARIGIPRGGGFYGYSRFTDAIAEDAITAMLGAGAILVEAEIPTIDELNADDAEIIVLIYEFKRDLNAYLATRTGIPAHNLADVIEFNLDHADRELKWFGQEFLELAEQEIFTEEDYIAALERGRRLAGPEGIDALLAEHDLDAIFAPTGSPAWTTDPVNGDHFLGASSGPAAVAGYPIINVPAGFAFGLPVGVSFFSTAWSEPTLIKIASGFEAVTHARQAPTFRPTIPFDEPVGNAFNGIAADPRVKHGGHNGEIYLQSLMKGYARLRKIFHSL